MSWFSEFLHSVVNGATARPPVSHPDQTPLHQALDAINKAGADASAALVLAAEASVTAFLTTKVGPVGAEVANAALRALADAAIKRIEPEGTLGLSQAERLTTFSWKP